MTYTVKKVGQIAEALTGHPFDSTLFDENEGFPLIRIRDLKNGGTNTFYKGPYDKKFIIRKGDFLIGMDGEFNLVEWKSGDALLNQRVCKLTITDGAVSPRYLYYFLPAKLKELEGATPFVTVKHLSHKSILDIDVPLPPLPVQKRIAAILEKADAAREKRRKANELTDQFLQSAFLEMFGDPVTNPKGWGITQLGDWCEELRYGTSTQCHPRMNESDLPVIRIPNILDGKINDCDLKYATLDESDIDKLRMAPGDILFVRSNGNPNYIARCAVFDKKQTHLFASYLIRARLKTKAMLLPVFVRDLINYPTYRDVLLKHARTTAGNYNINTVAIRGLKLIMPPFHLQVQYSEFLHKIELLRTRQAILKIELDNLFDVLAQRAFGGDRVE